MNSENNSFHKKIKATLPLLIISLICVVFISIVHHITRDKIKDNKQRAALAVINDVLTVEYDNDLFADKIEIDVPSYINYTNRISVYRARHNGEVVAVSLMPIITKGYNGNVQLIMGINNDGSLTGIRILQHNETEGFGDKAHQNKSDWLLGFNDHTYQEKEKEKWAIKKDGGEFDQLSGATITSRSIINIILKTLEYYTEHRKTFHEHN